MAKSIRVIELRPEHQEELFAMFRRHFGAWSTERLLRRWEWQSGAGNPWRALRPVSGVVALDKDRVVGGAVMFPVPWWVEGERLIFLCVSDLAIDRPYRTPVWRPMSRAILSRPYVMGSGMHPSLWKTMFRMGGILLPMSRTRFALQIRNRGWMCRAFRRHLPAAVGSLVSPGTAGRLLAWKPVEAVLRRFARGGGPPRGRPVPRVVPAADIRPFARFGADYDRFWEEARRRFRMTLDKDAVYMNWRYLDCPTFRRPILRGLYRDGKLVGVVVAGVYMVLDGDKRPCGVNGEILELITHDASAREVEALLLAACRELDGRGVDGIGAFCFDGTVREVLERIGFRPEEDKRFDKMVVFTDEDRRIGSMAALNQASFDTERVESTEGVYLTAGDGDMLNACLI